MHDAFISYSHAADTRLAAALERGLERIAKPLFRLRAIDVFRDQSSLSASPALWSAIAGHLEASRWFVLLGSRGSALSVWCAREVGWWLEHRGVDTLLIAWTDGSIAWDAEAGDFDWTRTDALPALLRGRYAEEPQFVDLRWAAAEAALDHRDARLRPALLDLAAPIRGVPKDSLDGDDVRAQRRTRQAAWGAAAAITAAATVAVWQAVEATRQRNAAETERELALSRQLAAQAGDLLVADPRRALLLAVQSHAVAVTAESLAALRRVTSALPLERLIEHAAPWTALAGTPDGALVVAGDRRGGLYRLGDKTVEPLVPVPQQLTLFSGFTALAVSPDASRVAAAGFYGRLELHAGGKTRTLETGDKVGEDKPGLLVAGLAFSPDSQTLATASTSGNIVVHRLDTGVMKGLWWSGVDMTAVAFGPDGRWLVAGGDRGMLRALPVVPGASAPQLVSAARDTVVGFGFERGGPRMRVASRAGHIEVFDTTSGKRIDWVDALEHGAITAFAASPDGRSFVTGHATGALVRWQRGQSDWVWRLVARHAAPVAGVWLDALGTRLVSAGGDGRIYVAGGIDLPPWTRRIAEPPPPPSAVRMSFEPFELTSPDGRWIARIEQTLDLGSVGGGSARLSILQGSDRAVRVDRVELAPATTGTVLPAFSADSSQLALQIGARLHVWDLASLQPLDEPFVLPPGARLAGARAQPPGWVLAGAAVGERFEIDAEPRAWIAASCALAGRVLSEDEWRRHLGAGRPYAPACR